MAAFSENKDPNKSKPYDAVGCRASTWSAYKTIFDFINDKYDGNAEMCESEHETITQCRKALGIINRDKDMAFIHTYKVEHGLTGLSDDQFAKLFMTQATKKSASRHMKPFEIVASVKRRKTSRVD
jgi:hypothetical protein